MRWFDLAAGLAVLAAVAIAARRPKVVIVVVRPTPGAPPPPPPPPLLTFEPMPAPGGRPADCPVCGWSPCLDWCRVGITEADLDRHYAEEEMYDDLPPPAADEDDEE
jgi:hypothetical protein